MMRLLYPAFKTRRSGLKNHHAIIRAVKDGNATRLRSMVETDLVEGRATMLRGMEAGSACPMGDVA